MPDVLTTAQLAELLHHADPESRAAAAKVGRLVGRGLPFIEGTRPRLFLRHQVLAWLEAQSTSGAPAPARVEPPRRRRQSGGGLAERIAALRGGA